MEKIRVSKVEGVTLWRGGESVEGTLHLTSHHLILSCSPLQTTYTRPPAVKPRELWITYPMIQHCAYRPATAASHQAPTIRVRCRDFTFLAFRFLEGSKAREVYDTIRSLTCRLGRIEKLYAFSYRPQAPEKTVNGWDVYDARREWTRLGIGEKETDKGWRISNINVDYGYCPTYPALLVVPSSISDNVLNYAGKYRSRVRIPSLTYLHPVNNCSITRSSQPCVGVRGNRSVQDEKLVAAIFSTSRTEEERTSAPRSSAENKTESTNGTSYVVKPLASPDTSSLSPAEAAEDEAIAKAAGSDSTRVYGAQQHNLIVDARPTVNAYAMQVAGKGSENMDHYPFATKAYLGIDNIHVMRDSLTKVIDALKDSDITSFPPNREQLTKSGWLKHISGLLDGSALIARQVGIHHSHVLIHCSDGWDRTSQLSALSQLMLDPYYRTIEGFIVLVEKDWLSFGHMFQQRSGFLSSEKWFEIENERTHGSSSRYTDETSSPASKANKTFGNALLSAKGFFSKSNESKESLGDSDGEMTENASHHQRSLSSGKAGPGPNTDGKTVTKIKETSPVFHQFLDATYQLLYQHPTRFEFNQYFLRRLLYHLYSCQYGTFLYDNEKARLDADVRHCTRSVWDHFLSPGRRHQFLNDKYDSVIDDHTKGKERLLFPVIHEVRWWPEIFGRKDEEMNGPALLKMMDGAVSGALQRADGLVVTPVLKRLETADNEITTAAPTERQNESGNLHKNNVEGEEEANNEMHHVTEEVADGADHASEPSWSAGEATQRPADQAKTKEKPSFEVKPVETDLPPASPPQAPRVDPINTQEQVSPHDDLEQSMRSASLAPSRVHTPRSQRTRQQRTQRLEME